MQFILLESTDPECYVDPREIAAVVSTHGPTCLMVLKSGKEIPLSIPADSVVDDCQRWQFSRKLPTD